VVAAPTGTYTANGVVSLKDTNYPIPAGARFVAPNGNDANPGTQAAPWLTVAHAVAAAPAGATIVLRQGNYRESVTINGKALTLQPYPHEKAWFKGSVNVNGWVKDGVRWRKDGWRYRFKQGSPMTATKFFDGYPVPDYPDLVFIDSKPLRQVRSKADVALGTFYVDYATQQLWIGSDPTGKLVEGAALDQALLITNAPGTLIRGLGFKHYATNVDENAAVLGAAERLTFVDNSFAWNAAAGLSAVASDAVVRSNTMAYNGQLGFHGGSAHRLLLEQNALAYNNQDRFPLDFEAGGLKIAASQDTIWRNNLAEENIGRGLWCDMSCYNTTIVRNISRNNMKSGIDYELSAKAIIASNVVVNNLFAGININESNDVDIYNNSLVRNECNVRVIEWKRVNTNPVTSVYAPWNVSDVVIKNNLLSNGMSTSERLLLVDDFSGAVPPKTGGQMVAALDYNGYHRTNTNVLPIMLHWSLGGQGDGLYKTIQQVRTAIGKEQHGLSVDNVAINPFFVNEAAGDYTLKSGSVAIGAGAPLSTAVANAIGVPAGVSVNMGALKW
jgi:mannuronan 5-epimerase